METPAERSHRSFSFKLKSTIQTAASQPLPMFSIVCYNTSPTSNFLHSAYRGHCDQVDALVQHVWLQKQVKNEKRIQATKVSETELSIFIRMKSQNFIVKSETYVSLCRFCAMCRLLSAHFLGQIEVQEAAGVSG